MINVFITDIQNKIEMEHVSSVILRETNDLKINFDLNETYLPFPCGHTILRIEANEINSDKILAIVTSLGFNCEILQDKICINQ